METVLLVDDESHILEEGRELLKEMGYRVLTAASGEEALDIYEKNRDGIHAVILDMIMPGMDGETTYKKLKEIDPEVNVILSGGFSLDRRATQTLENGWKGFVQKPFDAEQLSSKLREILNFS